MYEYICIYYIYCNLHCIHIICVSIHVYVLYIYKYANMKSYKTPKTEISIVAAYEWIRACYLLLVLNTVLLVMCSYVGGNRVSQFDFISAILHYY